MPYGEDIAICSPSQTCKIFMLTVLVRTVRTVHTVTWQGRTVHTMMCQVDDVASIHWLAVGESWSDTCPVADEWCEDTWPNPWAPRVAH
jgi:hypothetical protein